MCRWCMIALYYTIEISPEQIQRLHSRGIPLTNDERRYLSRVERDGGVRKTPIPPKAADKLAKWKSYRARNEEVLEH